MAKENPGKITLSGIQVFLERIGFEPPYRVDRCLAFQHLASGTLVLFSVPDDGDSVRPADLASLLIRLEYNGLAEEGELNQFRAGRLPKAS